MRDKLRQWGKYLLPLLGVILMFLWLNPKQGMDPTHVEDIGTLAGKRVSSDDQDFHRARNDVTVLESLARHFAPRFAYQAVYNMLGPSADPRLVQLLASQDQAIQEGVRQANNLFLGSLDPRDRALHMFLLIKEAERNNLQVTDEEANNALVGLNFTESEMRSFLGSMPQTTLKQALSDHVLIEKLNTIAMAGIRPSLPELKHLADDLWSQVDVRYTMLDANTPPANLPAPSPEAIQKQFNDYKAVLPTVAATNPPAINGHTYPFGYKYPDRIKFEYLEFDRNAARQAIMDRLSPQDMREDYARAYQSYEENKEKYRTPATSQPGFMGPTTGPASAPATRIKSFDEVKSQLVDEQIDKRVDNLLKKATEEALKQLNQPWAKQAPDEKGFKVKTPDAPLVNYVKVADDLQTRFHFRPTYFAVGEWQDLQQLRKQPHIGQAQLITQGRPQADFATLATNVRELTEDPARAGFLRQLQVGVEGPVLIDTATRNQFIYRVIEADKSHEPKTVDEVKDRVVHDLQRLAAYEKDIATARDLADQAARTGLQTLASQRKLAVETTGEFSRLTVPMHQQRDPNGRVVSVPAGLPEPTKIENIDKLRPVPAFVEASFNLAESTTPATAPATTAAAEKAPAPKTASTAVAGTGQGGPHRTTYVAMDQRLQVFVLELVSYQPVPSDKFDLRGKQFLTAVAQQQAAQVFMPKWNRLEAVFARLNYVPKHPLSKES